MVDKASFFSLDGQERTRALQNADAAFMDMLRYYLGPTGIPDKIQGVTQGVEMISPVAGAGRMQAATREGNYGQAALEGLGLVAPAGIAAYLAKMGNAAAPMVGQTLDEVAEAAKAFFAADLIPQGAAAETGAEALMRADDDLINIDDLNWEADDFAQAPAPRIADQGPMPPPPATEAPVTPMDQPAVPARADPVAETELFNEEGFLLPEGPPAPRAGVLTDSAGPATPTRYLNPNTGLYSPSFEAAKGLKQNVGTPEQMRAMLLKSGAKEEELIYSGFDDWLKGKKKVTKQEIEDVLGASAAGMDGNMPYMRVSQGARAGVTGVQGTALGDVQDSIYERMLEDYNAQRRERLLSDLQGRGYSFPQIPDEASFRDFADRVKAQEELRTGDNPIAGTPPIPTRYTNTVRNVERLLAGGLPFENLEIQRIIRSGITHNTDGMIRPDGSIAYTYDAIVDEFPDEEPVLELSRGYMPEEVRNDALRAYNMSPEEAANYLGIDVEDIMNNFDPGQSSYGNYVIPGMRNYSENQYMYDDAGRGVLSGIESLGVSPYEQKHFNAGKNPLMFFTLTGELQTPQGPAYHLAQLQSDIGQEYSELAKKGKADKFFVPGSTPTTVELSVPEKDLLRGYVEEAKSVEDLNTDVSKWLDRLYAKYLDEETGTLNKSAPGYEESVAELRAARDEALSRRIALEEVESTNSELFSKLEDFYGDVRTIGYTNAFGGDFSANRFEEILAGTAKPKKGYGFTGKTAALPFATSTNRWLDAAFKNELINAAKAGAEWITIPKGDDVQKYTGGTIEGQRKFYGGPDERGIAPTRLKNLAKDLIPFETEFTEMQATGYGPNAPTYDVFGMRLTPEIRKFLLEKGLPSFAQGGPVKGSSLDVDVFALD